VVGSVEPETRGAQPDPDPSLVDRVLDRVCDLPPDEREAELASLDVDESVRTAVRRLLAYFDEPPPELREPAVARAALDLTAPERVGRYPIQGVIGSGATGIVYRARQESPQRDVAVKVLRSQGVDEVARRFEREALLLGRLQHPGIAQIFESGVAELNGVPAAFIAMELVDGVPITEHAVREGASIRERVRLVAELAEAVHHAHLRGVIHRDLKPTNVLVTPGEGGSARGQVKVIDFGVARATDAGEGTLQTIAGEVLGTLAYMSPEQVRGDVDAIDARADVYGLGAIAYELLSGRLPHDLSGKTLTTAARIIVDEIPSALGALEPGCRGDLEHVVAKALAKEPERRYQSASALAVELRRWLAHEPVEARAAGALYHLRRFARRNRALVALSAVLVLALAAGAGIASYLAIANGRLAEREADARRDAVAQAAESERLRVLAEERAVELLHRTDPDRLARARREADRLWPAVPDLVPAMDDWIAGLAEPLVARLPAHEAALEALRAEALPYSDEDRTRDRETHPHVARLAQVRAELEESRALEANRSPHMGPPSERELRIRETFRARAAEEIAALEASLDERRTWRFTDRRDQERHDNLAALVDELREFAAPERGHLAAVRSRRHWASVVEERTISGPEPAAEWRDAVRAIRESPRYGGLELAPQLGLRPLGEDPASGLWEFCHVESGAPPVWLDDVDPPGLRVREPSGIVLVLVPGGTYRVGAQASDPSAPHFDPYTNPTEGGVREVRLESYFLAKFELTLAQWLRIGGEDVNQYGPTFTYYGTPAGAEALHANTMWNPAESVLIADATELLWRTGLRLPTTDEWEVGARGGTDTPWWSGPDASSIGLALAGNVADAGSGDTGALALRALERPVRGPRTGRLAATEPVRALRHDRQRVRDVLRRLDHRRGRHAGRLRRELRRERPGRPRLRPAPRLPPRGAVRARPPSGALAGLSPGARCSRGLGGPQGPLEAQGPGGPGPRGAPGSPPEGSRDSGVHTPPDGGA